MKAKKEKAKFKREAARLKMAEPKLYTREQLEKYLPGMQLANPTTKVFYCTKHGNWITEEKALSLDEQEYFVFGKDAPEAPAHDDESKPKKGKK